MTTLTDFFTRFRDDQEIGRDITDQRLEVYYDNGQEVGRVVQDRRSTRSQAELLDADNAGMARHWFERMKRTAEQGAAKRQR